MKAEVAPVAPLSDFWPRAFASHDRVTALPFIAWLVIASLNFLSQLVLRQHLMPGEFGTFNAALGLVSVLTVPLLALNHALHHYGDAPVDSLAQDPTRRSSLRAARLLAIETFTWIWAFVATVLLFLFLGLAAIPRFSEEFLSALTLLMALGALMSWTLCQAQNRLRLWAGLAVAAGVSRLIASAIFARSEPWAESGLAALLLAGFITLAPAMRARESDWTARLKACKTVLDRDFLLYAGAAFSVLLAVTLFANADRIAAQRGLGVPHDTNIGLVDLYSFDAYQTASLIAKSLLWGTQPLLWILFADRAALSRTTPRSLSFFWIYLGVLIAGSLILFFAGGLISTLFGNTWIPAFQRTTAQLTHQFLPSLVVVILPLALLQALGIFSLASRRYPECFALGACSLVYALVLFLFGQQPDLMITYMFGAGLISLMVILGLGVIRWGRKQP